MKTRDVVAFSKASPMRLRREITREDCVGGLILICIGRFRRVASITILERSGLEEASKRLVAIGTDVEFKVGVAQKIL